MKRSLFSFLVIMLLCANVVKAQFVGNGTESSPYQISSDLELQQLSTLVNAGNTFSGKYFIQTEDIDMSENFSEGFTPIGTENYPFEGVYNGNGKAISKLTVANRQYASLFYKINNAEIRNLNITNAQLNAGGSTNVYASGLVSFAESSTIENITVSGNLSATGTRIYFAGISANTQNSNVSNCVSVLTYNANDSFRNATIYDLVKDNSQTLVSNCLVSSFISSDFDESKITYYPFGIAKSFQSCLIAESNVPNAVFDENTYFANSYFSHQNTKITTYPFASLLPSGISVAIYAELMSGSLFGNSDWTEAENIFPRPTAVANTDVAIVAATPFLLGEGDYIGNVSQNFTANTDNNVSWDSESNQLGVNGNSVTVTLQRQASCAELNASRNNVQKTVVVGIAGNGQGSQSQPFTIANAGELLELSNAINSNQTFRSKNIGNGAGYYFKLMADITIAETDNWQPIGNAVIQNLENINASTSSVFAGNFDGDGHTISFVPSVGGLFGCLSNATIKNLIVENLENATAGASSVYGSISAYAVNSQIFNCVSKGEILGSDIIGGIVGEMYGGGIFRCVNEANFTGGNIAGGIAGHLSGSTQIESCLIYGFYDANQSNSFTSGAIVGSINSDTFQKAIIGNCAVLGDYRCPIISESNENVILKNNIVATSMTSEIMTNGRIRENELLTNQTEYTLEGKIYFDKQLMPAIDVNSNIVGLSTGEISGVSPSGLSELNSNNWQFAEGKYPIPSGITYVSDMMTLANLPIRLSENEDVRAVSDTIILPLVDEVQWSVSAETDSSVIEIVDNTFVEITPLTQGIANAGITATMGENLSRTYSIIIQKYLEINNLEDLILFSENVANGNYTDATVYLNVDIELDNTAANQFSTIGNYYGVFYGNGHTISNLKVPFFNSINNAEIHDLKLIFDGFGSADETAGERSAVLCVTSDNSLIANCDVTITSDFVVEQEGGLICYNATGSSIKKCQTFAENSSKITTDFNFGGVVYEASDCVLDSCVNNVPIVINSTASYINVSGIVVNSNGTIYNCINNASVGTSSENNDYVNMDVSVTGIVTVITNDLILENCTNNASIIGTYAGGIAGSTGLTGSTSGSGYKIGISRTVNNGSITGEYVAGIVSNISNPYNVSNCINTATIEGKYCSGIARESDGIISNCANYGSLRLPNNIDYENDNFELNYIASTGNTLENNVVAASVYNYYTTYSDKQNPDQLPSDGNSVETNEIFYDKQIGVINNIDSLSYYKVTELGTGKLTNDMIGSSLQSTLPSGEWVFDVGLYPLPAGIVETDAIRLARTPIYLKATANGGYETRNMVISNFSIPSGGGEIGNIEWQIEGGETISDSLNVSQHSDTVRKSVILNATLGNATKEYAFILHEKQGTTAENPLLITNSEDLYNIDNVYNGGYNLFFKVQPENNATTLKLAPEEDDNYYKVRCFYGNLDGNFILIYSHDTIFSSIFNYTNGAKISNLSYIADLSRNGGDNNSTTLIDNAENTTIENCAVYATIESPDTIGGLVLKASKGTTISNCLFVGEILSTGNASILGGLVGSGKDISINNSVVCAKFGLGQVVTDTSNMQIISGELVGDAQSVTVDSCLVVSSGDAETVSKAFGLANGTNNVTNSFFDIQMTSGTATDSSTLKPRKTRDLIAGGMFDTEVWTFVENKYPMPSSIAATDVAKLVAEPLFIGENDANMDSVTSVNVEAGNVEWMLNNNNSPTISFDEATGEFVVSCVSETVSNEATITAKHSTDFKELTYERTLNITKGDPSSVAVVASAEYVCEGGTITLTAKVNGADTCIWTFDDLGENITTENSNPFVLTINIPENYFTETVSQEQVSIPVEVWFDETGDCMVTDNISFSVRPSAKHFFTMSEVDSVVCQGTPVSLDYTSMTDYENDNFSIAWYNATDMNTPIATGTNLNIPSLSETTTFAVVATDNLTNCSYTETKTISAVPISPVNIIEGTQNQQICEGELIVPIVISADNILEYDFPAGLYAHVDTVNNRIEISGRPLVDGATNSFQYYITTCGDSFVGEIIVVERPRLTAANSSQVVNYGDAIQEITLEATGISENENILNSIVWQGTESANLSPDGLTVSNNGNTITIAGTPEVGEYIYTITLNGNEACPVVSYENFIGAYNTSALSPTAIDNTLCLGEGTTLSTLEHPSDLNANINFSYSWLLDGSTDTLSSDRRLDILPETAGEYVYTVIQTGSKSFGTIEVGDVIVENQGELVAYKSGEINIADVAENSSMLVVGADENNLTTMIVSTDQTTTDWNNVNNGLATDEYIPSKVDIENTLLQNYGLLYSSLSVICANEIFTSTEVENNTDYVYTFDPDYVRIGEVAKTESKSVRKFKQIARNSVSSINGRIVNLNRSGNITVSVQDHLSVEISSDQAALCNTESATISLTTDYPNIQWYNADDLNSVISTNAEELFYEGNYVAVTSNEYCFDTTTLRIRSLKFEAEDTIVICEPVTINIPLEDVDVAVAEENAEVSGTEITFTDEGIYSVVVTDAINNSCSETYVFNVEKVCPNLIVAGVVTDDNSGSLISGAKVRIGEIYSLTNEAGEYSMSIPNPYGEPQTVEVSANGYISITQVVAIQDNIYNLDFALTSPRLEILYPGQTEITSYPYVANTLQFEITNTGSAPMTWSSIIEDNNVNYLPADSIRRTRNSRSLWDINSNIQTQNNAEQSVATDGYFIYTTSWQRAGEFNRYTLDGYQETFSIDGVGNVRNLSFDGNYFYATNNSNIIYRLDLDEQILVDSIVVPENYGLSLRYCTYIDTDNDGFKRYWIGDWTDIYEIVLSGNNVISTRQITSDLNNAYCVAYDAITDGGCMWAFMQNSQNNGPSAEIVQLNMLGEQTGKTHYLDVDSISNSALAGGMCVSTNLYSDKYVLLTNIQNSDTTNQIIVYELARKETWISMDKKSGSIEAGGTSTINVTEYATTEDDYSASIKFKTMISNPQTESVELSMTIVAPQCPAVENLTAETDSLQYVNLSWDAVEPGEYTAVSYIVYSSESLAALDTVSETTYSPNNLSAGVHCYYVRALMTGETICVSEPSNTACAEIINVCNEPLILSTRTYSDYISLNWNMSTAVEYFDVVRNSVTIASAISETEYSDSISENGEYCYQIVAYYQNDLCEPKTSQTLCVTVNNENQEVPICDSVPEISIETIGKMLVVRWSKIDEAISYSLYRDRNYVTTTKDTSYFDMSLEYETEYCYTVEISCGNNVYNLSETVCATTDMEENDIEQITTANINVYPNPVDVVLFVEGENINSIQLINSVGQIVYEIENVSDNNIKLNVENYFTGVYVLKITTSAGEQKVERIVINR